ncbi:CAP domain-containing protein [Treponema berlinense]|uniref:CAP domain-containing protein n=1 Tax=Treponema berlinense TaxID=225004 RepID=UPI0023551FA2|nr:CAP domain-containing protein [Treponema berlinense]
MLNRRFLLASLLISLFSFGFLVSCDSVSWAEENSEYINSITSEEFQSENEQKLADEACAPTNGFYNCGFYDMKILVAINKYIKQRRPDSIMYYDSGLHEICKTHSKKMANKKQIFNINVKKISAGYKFVAQNVAFIMTMDDAAVDEIVNLWASNSRTRKNLENPDVNYFAVSSVNKSGANNVSDGCYYTLILAKK